MRASAEALAAAGFAVELPPPARPRHRHRGHARHDAGTTGRARPRRRSPGCRPGCPTAAGSSSPACRWAARSRCWLATRHPELAGIVLHQRRSPSRPADLRHVVEDAVDGGIEVFPGIGSDIADPDATETAYEGTPLRPLLSLFDAVDGVPGRARRRSPARC